MDHILTRSEKNSHYGPYHMDQNLIAEQAKNIAALLRSLMRELGAGLQDQALDLPLAQLRVCGVLRTGPRSMSALSRELGVSLSAVTQIADRLERAGMVTRIAKGTDRRVRRLELTERGETIMRLHDQARVERLSAALAKLNDAKRQEAAAALQTLVGAVAAARSENGDREEQPTAHPTNSEVLL